MARWAAAGTAEAGISRSQATYSTYSRTVNRG